ncbi:hypothetical protein [Scytonema sp. PCC 10023]|uniref:hypothetical protein n=1 Tax=Scytonema sp. PCC 10023 TaxID=1680591 RepID=UPI0039C5C84E
MDGKDQQQITVDIAPISSNPTRTTPLTPQPNRIDAFKRGWENALALPDNLTDLLFDITASIAVPALIASCWSSLPIPYFIRIGGVVALAVAGLFLWQLLELPAVRGILIFRLTLVTLGVILGL